MKRRKIASRGAEVAEKKTQLTSAISAPLRANYSLPIYPFKNPLL
jgi:hypothetical protein